MSIHTQLSPLVCPHHRGRREEGAQCSPYRPPPPANWLRSEDFLFPTPSSPRPCFWHCWEMSRPLFNACSTYGIGQAAASPLSFGLYLFIFTTFISYFSYLFVSPAWVKAFPIKPRGPEYKIPLTMGWVSPWGLGVFPWWERAGT